MNEKDLGPIPEPTAEEPQLVPGGPDAPSYDPADEGLSRDLDPDDNPAVDDVLPDEIAEPDDKQQEPDNGADQEAGTPRESPDSGSSDASPEGSSSDDEPTAGQEAEDGSVEPPA
jgi:hypothetical protein